jgi:hypothetical protein
MKDWSKILDKLLMLEMELDVENRPHRPHFVKLTKCGEAAWSRFTTAHADEVNNPDFPDYLRGPWAKLRGYGARLALVLHLLRWACDEVNSEEVDGESMNSAAELVAYFKGHARKVLFAMESDPKVVAAKHILDCLKRNPSLGDFSRRDLYQCLRRTLANPDDLDAPLALLVSHGYLRPYIPSRDGKKGPNPRRFLRNPLWTHTPCTQDTQEDSNEVETRASRVCELGTDG